MKLNKDIIYNMTYGAHAAGISKVQFVTQVVVTAHRMGFGLDSTPQIEALNAYKYYVMFASNKG